MTVHMIKLYAEPPKGEAENAIDNWVTNHNEWKDDPTEHSLIESEIYLSGVYRFTQDDEATELLDSLEDKLSSVQGGLWYRVGYHICDHDESSRGGCEWEEVREGGTIPEEVPTF